MKVAVELCIYDEEQFIESTITDIVKKLEGIDFIYVLDGAWKYSGGEIQSKDKTEEIVKRLGKKFKKKIDIIYDFKNQIYSTQSYKRNTCLEEVEKIMDKRDPEANWYHLVIDGDESIGFPNGLQDVVLNKKKSGVDQLWPSIGVLKCYAYGSTKTMLSPRFIPAFKGYHYHTEKRMVIHDKYCNDVCDYNLDVKKFIPFETFVIDRFFLVNKWNCRKTERGMMKITYNSITLPNPDRPCTFRFFDCEPVY